VQDSQDVAGTRDSAKERILPQRGVSVRNLTLLAGPPDERRPLLDGVSLELPRNHFAAIIGASGCGKSTLLRALAGILQPATGDIEVFGYPLAEYKRRFPLALGYLPQFSKAHDELTVAEILCFAAELQLPSHVDGVMRGKWLDYLIDLSGLEKVKDQFYKTLSGGQRRRVALAEALMSDPPILLVDELTSGLDPHAETTMMEWLSFLAHRSGKTILLVTHAIQNLDQTDSVLFMKDGKILFQGSHRELLRQTNLKSIEELYHIGGPGLFDFGTGKGDDQSPNPSDAGEIERVSKPEKNTALSSPEATVQTGGPATSLHQFMVLVKRRFLLLSRDRSQILLHAILLFTFPILVAVFALGGLPQVRDLSLSLDANILRSLQEQLLYLKDSMSSATLVSGLIMFQVILLTLAGSNNGSREITGEQDILEKERRNGLFTSAYVSSKFILVTLLTLFQALWMTWFVKAVCKFPGEFGMQFGILFLTTLAMGATCLAISAYSSSTEKASLQAIYLVGLQLPLSGAVLALPEWLVWITRPFIVAYWGWSGYLKSLSDYRIYDIVRQTTKTWLASPGLVCAVLVIHILLAFLLCCFFVSRHHHRS